MGSITNVVSALMLQYFIDMLAEISEILCIDYYELF